MAREECGFWNAPHRAASPRLLAGCSQCWSAVVREPGDRGERPPEPGRTLGGAPRALAPQISRRSRRCWRIWAINGRTQHIADTHGPIVFQHT